MQYVIYNESKKSYLCYDKLSKISATTDTQRAEKFDCNRAKNIINNTISKKERNKWSIIEFVDKQSKSISKSKKLDTALSKEIFKFEQGILNETISSFNQIDSTIHKLQTYQSKLFSELSNADKEIVDIQHYIEFFNLDAAKGFNIYKMLQEKLRMRRVFNDELSKLKIVLSFQNKDIDLKNLVKSIQGLKNREYEPRVLNELFGIQTGTNT